MPPNAVRLKAAPVPAGARLRRDGGPAPVRRARAAGVPGHEGQAVLPPAVADLTVTVDAGAA